MNSPSEDIKDILELAAVDSSSGIIPDLTFGTNLFIGILPDSPDLCVCVKDTSGSSPETHSTNPLEYPTLQILVRGTVSGYKAAYRSSKCILELLRAKTNFNQGGTKYHHMHPVSDVGFIGSDGKNRPVFSMNFEIMRSDA